MMSESIVVLQEPPELLAVKLLDNKQVVRPSKYTNVQTS